METSTEMFSVPQCPVCGKAHRYSLAVIRSQYLFSAVMPEPGAEKRVHRLFTCPKTGNDFEGEVVLKDDPKDKIVSVKVTGIIEEET